MIKEYSEFEKIEKICDMEIRQSEIKKINKLLEDFDDIEVHTIGEINHIYFKIGFRYATELLK